MSKNQDGTRKVFSCVATVEPGARRFNLVIEKNEEGYDDFVAVLVAIKKRGIFSFFGDVVDESGRERCGLVVTTRLDEELDISGVGCSAEAGDGGLGAAQESAVDNMQMEGSGCGCGWPQVGRPHPNAHGCGDDPTGILPRPHIEESSRKGLDA